MRKRGTAGQVSGKQTHAFQHLMKTSPSKPQPGEWGVTLQMPLAGQDHRIVLPPVMVFTSARGGNQPQSHQSRKASRFSKNSNGKS